MPMGEFTGMKIAQLYPTPHLHSGLIMFLICLYFWLSCREISSPFKTAQYYNILESLTLTVWKFLQFEKYFNQRCLSCKIPMVLTHILCWISNVPCSGAAVHVNTEMLILLLYYCKKSTCLILIDVRRGRWHLRTAPRSHLSSDFKS